MAKIRLQWQRQENGFPRSNNRTAYRVLNPQNFSFLLPGLDLKEGCIFFSCSENNSKISLKISTEHHWAKSSVDRTPFY
jgi:hypothetical protein